MQLEPDKCALIAFPNHMLQNVIDVQRQKQQKSADEFRAVVAQTIRITSKSPGIPRLNDPSFESAGADGKPNSRAPSAASAPAAKAAISGGDKTPGKADPGKAEKEVKKPAPPPKVKNWPSVITLRPALVYGGVRRPLTTCEAKVAIGGDAPRAMTVRTEGEYRLQQTGPAPDPDAKVIVTFSAPQVDRAIRTRLQAICSGFTATIAASELGANSKAVQGGRSAEWSPEFPGPKLFVAFVNLGSNDAYGRIGAWTSAYEAAANTYRAGWEKGLWADWALYGIRNGEVDVVREPPAAFQSRMLEQSEIEQMAAASARQPATPATEREAVKYVGQTFDAFKPSLFLLTDTFNNAKCQDLTNELGRAAESAIVIQGFGGPPPIKGTAVADSRAVLCSSGPLTGLTGLGRVKVYAFDISQRLLEQDLQQVLRAIASHATGGAR